MSFLSEFLKDTVKTVTEVAQVAAPIVSPFLSASIPGMGAIGVGQAMPPQSPTLTAQAGTVGNPQAISAVPVAGGAGPGGGAGGAGVVPQQSKIFGLPRNVLLIGGGIAALGIVFLLIRK